MRCSASVGPLYFHTCSLSLTTGRNQREPLAGQASKSALATYAWHIRACARTNFLSLMPSPHNGVCRAPAPRPPPILDDVPCVHFYAGSGVDKSRGATPLHVYAAKHLSMCVTQNYWIIGIGSNAKSYCHRIVCTANGSEAVQGDFVDGSGQCGQRCSAEYARKWARGVPYSTAPLIYPATSACTFPSSPLIRARVRAQHASRSRARADRGRRKSHYATSTTSRCAADGQSERCYQAVGAR